MSNPYYFNYVGGGWEYNWQSQTAQTAKTIQYNGTATVPQLPPTFSPLNCPPPPPPSSPPPPPPPSSPPPPPPPLPPPTHSSKPQPSSSSYAPHLSKLPQSLSQFVPPSTPYTRKPLSLSSINNERMKLQYCNSITPQGMYPRGRYINPFKQCYMQHTQYSRGWNRYNYNGRFNTRGTCNNYSKKKFNNRLDDPDKRPKKRKKPLSQNVPQIKAWSVMDAKKALEVEKECNKKDKRPIIIKFPDLELNPDIVTKLHPEIKTVHFQQPCNPRFCFVTIKESADPEAVMNELRKVPFGQGFLSAEYKKDREEEIDVGPEDIDPLTLYVGNLPQDVTKDDMLKSFPKEKRIDIGYAKKMRNTRYAFVSFRNVDDSIEAFRQTHATQIHHKSLIVRFRRLNGTVGLPGEPKPQMPSKRSNTCPNGYNETAPTYFEQNCSNYSITENSSDSTFVEPENCTDVSINPWEMVDVSHWEMGRNTDINFIKQEPFGWDYDDEDIDMTEEGPIRAMNSITGEISIKERRILKEQQSRSGNVTRETGGTEMQKPSKQNEECTIIGVSRSSSRASSLLLSELDFEVKKEKDPVLSPIYSYDENESNMSFNDEFDVSLDEEEENTQEQPSNGVNNTGSLTIPPHKIKKEVVENFDINNSYNAFLSLNPKPVEAYTIPVEVKPEPSLNETETVVDKTTPLQSNAENPTMPIRIPIRSLSKLNINDTTPINSPLDIAKVKKEVDNDVDSDGDDDDDDDDEEEGTQFVNFDAILNNLATKSKRPLKKN